MLEFFESHGGTIIVGAIVLAAVALIIGSIIRNKRGGKHICGGDCAGCNKCVSQAPRNK